MTQHILLVTQVYMPDPAAVARLMADVALELAARGHRVTVLTADRGYDDPSVRYASSISAGIEVRRLRFSSFGKRNMALRIVAGLSFTLQAAARALWIRGVDSVVVSTSPPMAALAGVILRVVRRLRVVYWPMDLNPDQTLALNLKTERAFSVRLLEAMNRSILRRADAVIALDRYMAQRLERKQSVGSRLVVVPPWGEADSVEPIRRHDNPFRQQHGLGDKVVIMYSGTLGPSNPLDTLLDAAKVLEAQPALVFVFVGGGLGMRDVRARGLRNVVCLPYEPLSRMKYSLAAADVHVVSLGDAMVGIVHPCKVYGAMATGRPILFVGPRQSHVTDLLSGGECGWSVTHGDVDGAVRIIRGIVEAPPGELARMGARSQEIIRMGRTRIISCGRVCDVIERRAAPGIASGPVAHAGGADVLPTVRSAS